MSTAADYRSDTLQGIDFDIPCELKWGSRDAEECGAPAVADIDFVNGSDELSTKFACADCVAGVGRGGFLLGVRYF